MKKIFLTALWFLFGQFYNNILWAQSAVTIIEQPTGINEIDKSTFIFIDSGARSLEKVLLQQFTVLSDFRKKKTSAARLAGRRFYTRFAVFNYSNTPGEYYYYPGKLFRNLQLYIIQPGAKLRPIATRGLASGFIPIKVPPGQTEFLLQGQFFKTHITELRSVLVKPDHLQDFKRQMYGSLDMKKIVGILLSGMLVMMILVTLLNYYITRKTEFLYNSCYSVCMGFLIFLTTYLGGYPGWFRGFFLSYLDLLLLIGGTIFYLAFTRHFLNTNKLHPTLNKFLSIEAWILGVLMLAYSILHFGFQFYNIELAFEFVLKVLALAAGVVYIYLSLIQKNKLMNYLAVGAATQVVFFSISLVLMIVNPSDAPLYTSPFFYFELGVVGSIIFFLLGLFYKNRQELTTKIQEQESLKLASEKLSFETQLSIYKVQQEERNRISADMHDDLGAGMTAIRLYSELAKSKSGETILPEIEKISAASDDLINKMNAIIWSMSSHNDTLGNMVAYIRSYCIDYFENTGIATKIVVPENLPALVVNGIIRRNVFLVVKEALQNILKHASATEVRIVLAKEDGGLSLVIHDNGRGIDFNNVTQFSNGLKNMRKRMEAVEIAFAIENDSGTKIRLFRQTA